MDIYGNIYHQYTPNVSIYTIHGSYAVGIWGHQNGFTWQSTEMASAREKLVRAQHQRQRFSHFSRHKDTRSMGNKRRTRAGHVAEWRFWRFCSSSRTGVRLIPASQLWRRQRTRRDGSSSQSSGMMTPKSPQWYQAFIWLVVSNIFKK